MRSTLVKCAYSIQLKHLQATLPPLIDTADTYGLPDESNLNTKYPLIYYLRI